MKPETPAQRVARLRSELERHNRLYYTDAAPEISDRDYDLLYQELKDLEAKHPELASPDSPTQRVGGEPLKEFQRVRHKAPMLSLEKKEDLRELELFETDIRRKVPDFAGGYIVEPKIDGVSLSLHYTDGQLTQAVTRGDGEFGDDITVNIRTLRDIPLLLRLAEKPRHLEVRGEVYMREADRIALNEKLRARGDKTFANTRNATAGSLKQLDPRIVAERPLRAVFYAIGSAEGIVFASHSEELQRMQEAGLPVPGVWRKAATMKEAEAAACALKENESELPYEIDGCVIKVDDNETCRRLGLKTNVPAYAVAYKRPEWFNETTTVLKNIVVQVGRTGVLAPVAELEPVFLDGTTIARVTLHNASEIERKDIRIGDTVVIKRAGRVIPAIVRVVDDLRKGTEQVFRMPDRCPSCGDKVVQRKLADGDKVEVALRCENEQCPEQQARLIEYFASRAALNIDGLGEIVANQLVASGLARTPFALFGLKLEELSNLNLGTPEEPRQLGEKVARRILDALEAARQAPLAKWLYALGLPSVGETVAAHVAASHTSIHELPESPKLLRLLEYVSLQKREKVTNPKARSNATKDDAEKRQLDVQHKQVKEQISKLKSIISDDGPVRQIGPAVASDLLEFFRSEKGVGILAKLRELDIDPKGSDRTSAAKPSAKVSGKNVVVTGSLQGYTRDSIRDKLRSLGANVTDCVSKKTDYLICGTDAGSKLDKARQLGVPVVEESGLVELLGDE